MYGSSRLGIYNLNKDLTLLANTPINLGSNQSALLSIFERNKKFFELQNHLGNVLATVSDEKIGIDLNNDGIIDYYTANVVSAGDYYPFGQTMPGRSYNNLPRYTFNGKEYDKETGYQDYGFRMYSKIGRFISVDPITNQYPDLTPYQFASNTPIWAVDIDGAEGMISMPDERTAKMNTIAAEKIKEFVVEKHSQGMRNVSIAEHARQMAIKQGRVDGDGITWYTKSLLYIAPWWNSTATFSDANDGAVLMSGKNLDGSKATFGDYTAAGLGIFIPIVSGGAIKNVFKGFSTAAEGYKYGGKTFKNAEQFEKALVKAGTYEDKVGMIQSVLRDVAKTNNWKKAGDLSKKTGNEFYDLGNGTFGSLDKQHGHFEIFKQEGKTLSHQGSINIDGIKNKERNKSYDIKL